MTVDFMRRILNGFNPQEHGLVREFVLTKYTGLKGCGCKVPQNILLEYLQSFGQEKVAKEDSIGIGLDSCLIPLRHPGLSLVQTTDFFYPLVDDPYIMGRITCANVLSDLYAMGVADCDNMLMLLGVCTDMSEEERSIVVSMFINGFKDLAEIAGTKIRGGQTVRCPWLLLGGVASSVVQNDEVLKVTKALSGDVLVLTKPLGTQVAVNAYDWHKKKVGRIEELGLDERRIIRAYQQATAQMCRLNRNAAKLLHKYEAHASTDVTGFGIFGHADNLAKVQENDVHFIIEMLPIIDYMDEIAKKMLNGNGFNLFKGTSAETSGGLLVALSPENAQKFMQELQELDGHPSWIVGRVESTNEQKGAVIVSNYEVVPIPSKIH